ncbi:hypothetical protein CDL15_Pgr012725 [Punica granatum]|uniref:Uncharacterized protein n=1 Tax=Punica granatum TaxID=22663 RepID=A0A218XE78_PUNGR|nr:hypothetical protein CDL15_Pgr012725 [Punica granatum]
MHLNSCKSSIGNASRRFEVPRPQHNEQPMRWTCLMSRQAKEELTGIRNPRASGGSNGNRERRRLWRRTAAILLVLGWKDASNHENNIGNGLKRLKTVW